MNYKVSHPTKVVECEIDLPSSKSISNRLLIIQSLCKAKFQIKNLSNSEDTIALKKALSSKSKVIDVGPAGTSFRFLTSYLSTIQGEKLILTGTERMKERPIHDLVKALGKLGANIKYLEKDKYPPLEITGKELEGGKIQIKGNISSQFISSLLLIAPTLKKGLEIELLGDIVSKSYIDMTLSLMEEFGIYHNWIGNKINIKSQEYTPKDYVVEADWSSASFWFEVAALSKDCNIKLNGLSEKSIQGDKNVRDIFSNLGVTSSFNNDSLILIKDNTFSIPSTINLINTPDLYQPLKCSLFGIKQNSNITGISTLKDKETNRIEAVDKEFTKITSSQKTIETYKDHRMAMSFAPLCLKFDELQINNITVVKKSYPNFWEDLKKGGFKISPLIPTSN